MSIFLTSPENFAQASGLIDFSILDQTYEAIIDMTFIGMSRTILLHLPPQIEADPTSYGNQATAYNPFFDQAVMPSDSTKVHAVKVNTRDIPFSAHIRIGPKDMDDITGAGRLLENEAQTTTVIESHGHIASCLAATIDGERYRLKNGPRTIGFKNKTYIITIWERVQERENTNPDSNT